MGTVNAHRSLFVFDVCIFLIFILIQFIDDGDDIHFIDLWLTVFFPTIKWERNHDFVTLLCDAEETNNVLI